MNELFLYLYLGDIADKVRIICTLCVVVFVGVILFYLIVSEEASISSELRKKLSKASRISKWIVVFFFIVGVLMPSKFFFYTLAGAKAGEITISSEIGKKAIEALNTQLDEYIKEAKNAER